MGSEMCIRDSLKAGKWAFHENVEANAESVSYSQDGRLIAVGQSTGEISIFFRDNLGHSKAIEKQESLSKSAGEHSLVASILDGQLLDKLSAPPGSGHNLAWSDQLLFSANSDGYVMSWRPISPGPLVRQLPDAKVLSVIENQILGIDPEILWTSANNLSLIHISEPTRPY